MISVYVVQIKNLKNVVVNKMDEELALEANNITKTIAMSILNKSNVPNADKIIKTFTGEDND